MFWSKSKSASLVGAKYILHQTPEVYIFEKEVCKAAGEFCSFLLQTYLHFKVSPNGLI